MRGTKQSREVFTTKRLFVLIIALDCAPSVAKTKGGIMLNIAGIVRNSFVDWPAKIAFVVFLGGCNFACPHCHNYDILSSTANKLPFVDVLEEIKYQIGFIDGVVLSGGEPAMYPQIREIITQIRALGLPIKLDTNGSNFLLLKELVMGKLVDYVAMDIKAPFDQYVPLGFIKGNKNKTDLILENVKSSIEFLKEGHVPYMFRTTPIPELTEKDFEGIKSIVGKAPWIKNNFVEVGGTN